MMWRKVDRTVALFFLFSWLSFLFFLSGIGFVWHIGGCREKYEIHFIDCRSSSLLIKDVKLSFVFFSVKDRSHLYGCECFSVLVRQVGMREIVRVFLGDFSWWTTWWSRSMTRDASGWGKWAVEEGEGDGVAWRGVAWRGVSRRSVIWGSVVIV